MRYIDADLIKYVPLKIRVDSRCIESSDFLTTKKDIDAIPTADVEEVRHGRWETEEDEYQICTTEFTCSVCGEVYSSCELTDKQFIEMMKYCPNCGAKMDKEEEE